MLRFLTALVCLCTLFLTASHSVASAAPAPGKTIQVMVQLKGFPLAADPNLKTRDRATRFRFRLDTTLASAERFRQSLRQYEDQEIGYIRSAGINLQPNYRFQILFNGFSASVPESELSRLRREPNVAAVLPVRHYHRMLDKSVGLIHAPEAWSQAGGAPNAGRGVFIAQIDTGIDISHPCFKDTGYPAPPFGRRADSNDNLTLTNNKVIVARAFPAQVGNPTSAADTSGHGTFGAAIEACDANTPTPVGTTITGVAPGAWLGNYNVFPDGGGTTSDSQIISGLEAALQDGADIANFSLGGPAGDQGIDFETAAVHLATKAGMVVVVAAGNAGPIPQSVSTPAISPDAIAVGATSNAHQLVSSTATVTGDNVPSVLTKIRANEGSTPWKGPIGPAPVVYVGLARIPKDDPDHPDANDLAGKDLKGKIALIQRGTTFFSKKINNVANAGAIGAIIFDNREEINIFRMDVQGASLPAMSITQDDGQAFLDYLNAHPDAQVTMNSDVSVFGEKPNVLTDFSGRGYGADYQIKPDVVAPGQDIYSATENTTQNNDLYDVSGFASANGTSFSAPHVTGAVALILQQHPKWTPAMVKSALMETGDLSVTEGAKGQQTPTVMDTGAGLVNVAAAMNPPALLTPAAVSFGAVNVAGGTATPVSTINLSDVGGGSGTWQLSVHQLAGDPGLTVSVPGSLSIPSGGNADIPVHLTVGASVPNGDYDGYVMLTKGSVTIHAPYFVHVLSQTVKQGSVLLVDDSTSRFQPGPGQAPLTQLNVSRWYEQTLSDLGIQYTYWDEGKLGAPSLAEMKQASAVIYFTGNNLNGLAPQNGDSESQIPPLSATDVDELHQYMDAGGKLLLTGMGAGLTDPLFTIVKLGAVADNLSLYDDQTNDKDHKGGVSPPKPSALPDVRSGPLKASGLFAGLKPIDYSTGGDGAGDNLAGYDQGLGQLVGVVGLSAISGNLGDNLFAFGEPALKTANVPHQQSGFREKGIDVAIVSSDESTFKHRATYKGRSVFLSFGFEGINNNTGFATRDDVMRRIMAWLNETSSARVTITRAKHGAPTVLRAAYHATQGAHPVAYAWQIGRVTLGTSAHPPAYRFPRAGTYSVRVEVFDNLGHQAVSGWTKVRVS